MEWINIPQLIGNIGVAGTAIFGAWKAYHKFIKPVFSWCKNQLGVVKKVNFLENFIYTHELKVNSLINLSPFAIFKADSDTGNIVYVNSAWTKLFDLNLEEAQSWYKHIEESAKVRYAWQEMISKKIMFDEDFTVTSNHLSVSVNCKAIVQKNRFGKYLKVIGVIVKL